MEAVMPIRSMSHIRKFVRYQEQAAQSSTRANILPVNSGAFENALMVERPLSEDAKCDMTGDLTIAMKIMNGETKRAATKMPATSQVTLAK
ncbi:hypothetical protein Trco_008445 [Trichoderma cornu-damae]|uniref:Uncharacterized protein n=1 Tax=Trichoderma cornu-damae TaxID=654480 RepID=A0A9P8QFE6_9HYPO|nr:hypothetical protein Trco_008445 [Trichoderma cornu-damae]